MAGWRMSVRDLVTTSRDHAEFSSRTSCGSVTSCHKLQLEYVHTVNSEWRVTELRLSVDTIIFCAPENIPRKVLRSEILIKSDFCSDFQYFIRRC